MSKSSEARVAYFVKKVVCLMKSGKTLIEDTSCRQMIILFYKVGTIVCT
ncbi:hypothetical protein ABER98_20980 [Domibacillus aminovorans]